MTLRPYQQTAVGETLAAFRGGAKGVLVVMPTGTGKTTVGIHVAFRMADGDKNVLVVAPRREIANQWVRRRDIERWRVATIQLLEACDYLIDASSSGGKWRPDVIVLDEARHYLSDEWSKLREAYPTAKVLGLDATPARGDGRGLEQMFDTLFEPLTTRQAIDEGWLVPYGQIYRPDHALAPGELAQDPIDVFGDRGVFGGFAYGRRIPRSTIVFCSSVEEAQTLAIELSTRTGERCRAAAIHSGMSSRERAEVLAQYDLGDINVLCNHSILLEGWDSPRTSAIVLARRFASAVPLLQAIGRGLRPCDGKSDCIVVDLTGCTHDLGEPTDDWCWSLEGKALRRRDAQDVRFCPVCGGVVDAPPCTCGYEGELRKRAPRVLGLPIDRFVRKRTETNEQRIWSLARWIHDARIKGYKLGSASHRYKATYGEWPTPETRKEAYRKSH
ncbi:MAG: DEAD/DEAH box helicase [Polyangiaceae bacterium]|nr:DEAD/DEAH box helicase [Polyangiaceae bacterium]